MFSQRKKSFPLIHPHTSCLPMAHLQLQSDSWAGLFLSTAVEEAVRRGIPQLWFLAGILCLIFLWGWFPLGAAEALLWSTPQPGVVPEMCSCFNNSLAALHRIGMICPSSQSPRTLASGTRSHRWLCLGTEGHGRGCVGGFGNINWDCSKRRVPGTSPAFSHGKEQLEGTSEDLGTEWQGELVGKGSSALLLAIRGRGRALNNPATAMLSTCAPKPTLQVTSLLTSLPLLQLK